MKFEALSPRIRIFVQIPERFFDCPRAICCSSIGHNPQKPLRRAKTQKNAIYGSPSLFAALVGVESMRVLAQKASTWAGGFSFLRE